MTFPFPAVQGALSVKLPKAVNYLGATLSTGSGALTGNITASNESPDRIIVAMISMRRDASRSLSSVTIGGVTAILPVNTADSVTCCYIAYAVVPTGTTLAYNITLSGDYSNFGAQFYELVSMDSTTPIASALVPHGSMNTTAHTITRDVLVGDVFLATYIWNNSSASATWSGTGSPVEDYDQAVSSATRTAAHAFAVAANPTAAYTCNRSSASGGGSGAWVHWR